MMAFAIEALTLLALELIGMNAGKGINNILTQSLV